MIRSFPSWRASLLCILLAFSATGYAAKAGGGQGKQGGSGAASAKGSQGGMAAGGMTTDASVKGSHGAMGAGSSGNNAAGGLISEASAMGAKGGMAAGSTNDASTKNGMSGAQKNNNPQITAQKTADSQAEKPTGKVNDKLALNEAVTMVQSRFGASAVKTKTVDQAGKTLYRIRLMNGDKSKVWTVDVDAQTGEVH